MRPMSLASLLSPADLPPPFARPVPRPSRGDGWNTLADQPVDKVGCCAQRHSMLGHLAPDWPNILCCPWGKGILSTGCDVEVFVFTVEAELEAMDRERVGVHRRGRKPDFWGAARFD